ncbi:MAG: DNA-binding response regulator, partial [Anaerolineales bacterium]|nr:DNA-binding response regulator [Anaerolineales bacterium]
LEDERECTVVGQIAGDEDLDAALGVYRPDVILWDLGWNPEENLERIVELGVEDIPMLTLLQDESFTQDALTAGARGLLPRQADRAKLTMAVRATASGLAVIDPGLSAELFPTGEGAPPYSFEPLTPREQEVLGLIAEGLTNKAIAHQLDISEFTVKYHVNAVLRKLGAQSRTEAAMRAARLGLISF